MVEKHKKSWGACFPSVKFKKLDLIRLHYVAKIHRCGFFTEYFVVDFENSDRTMTVYTFVFKIYCQPGVWKFTYMRSRIISLCWITFVICLSSVYCFCCLRFFFQIFVWRSQFLSPEIKWFFIRETLFWCLCAPIWQKRSFICFLLSKKNELGIFSGDLPFRRGNLIFSNPIAPWWKTTRSSFS